MDGTMRKPCASTWCQARVCAYINCNTKSTIHDSLRAPRTLTLHTSHSLCASRGATRHGAHARSRSRARTDHAHLRSRQIAKYSTARPACSLILPLTAHAPRAPYYHTTPVSAAHTETTQQHSPGPRHASDSTVIATNSHAATRDTTTKTSHCSHSCRRATTSQITPSGRG